MAASQTIIDEPIVDPSGNRFRLSVEGTLDDDAGTIEILLRVIQPNDHPLTIVKLTATVTNPVDIGAVILVAAGYYGICVAANMVGATGKIVYLSYDHSKKDKPSLSRKERCGDLFRRIVGRSSEFKGEAIKTLAGCASKIVT